jgi:hypothetical protein
MKAIVVKAASDWGCASQTIGNTVTALDLSMSDVSCVVIQAKADNSGYVYVGNDDTITSSGDNAGCELAAGQAITLPLRGDVDGTIYLVASASGQKVFISYFNTGY